MISRFHCPFPLHPGATVQLPDEAAHHALKVLRVADGDAAILFDGRGGQWSATLHPAGKHLRATLSAFEAQDHEPPVAVTLAQCLPSGDKMDYVVQKAVELGVSRVVAIAAKRSVMRLSGERMERRVTHWQNIAIAACEQSGRNRVPQIAGVIDLPQYLAQIQGDNGSRWICLPDNTTGAAVSIRLRDQVLPDGSVTLFIGPEGGFEDSEVLAARAAGFVPLRLGSRVLRTETAGPAALAAIMALWGDW